MTAISEDNEQPVRSRVITCRNYTRLGYERMTHGVYGQAPDVSGLNQWDAQRRRFLLKVRAIMEVYAGKAIALWGMTALQVLDVALPTQLEDWQNCHVLVPTTDYRPLRRGVVAHRSSAPLRIWGRRNEAPLLHPVEHWLQLTDASDDAMIEVGDGLMRRQRPLLSEDDIRARLAEMKAVKGLPRARRVMQWVRSGTDSIYETRTRLALVRAGLPCPQVNHPVQCRSVGRTFHVDMGYDVEKVAIEYDGSVHVGNRRQMEIDAVRRRALQEEGWLLITVTADQLAHPTDMVRSVEAALILRRATLPGRGHNYPQLR